MLVLGQLSILIDANVVTKTKTDIWNFLSSGKNALVTLTVWGCIENFTKTVYLVNYIEIYFSWNWWHKRSHYICMVENVYRRCKIVLPFLPRNCQKELVYQFDGKLFMDAHKQGLPKWREM